LQQKNRRGKTTLNNSGYSSGIQKRAVFLIALLNMIEHPVFQKQDDIPGKVLFPLIK